MEPHLAVVLHICQREVLVERQLGVEHTELVTEAVGTIPQLEWSVTEKISGLLIAPPGEKTNSGLTGSSPRLRPRPPIYKVDLLRPARREQPDHRLALRLPMQRSR